MTDRNIKIAMIISEYRVIINAGTQDGIKKNDEFLIIDEKGFDIIDPDTGDVLGHFDGYKGKLVVTEVEEKYSYCETPTIYKSTITSDLSYMTEKSIGSLFGEKEQKKLNIDKGDIVNINDRITNSKVKVGDRLAQLV